MWKQALACTLLLATSIPAVAADDTLAAFQGGIGVIPVSSGQGTAATATVVNRNLVRGVQPAGQIWVIDRLEARVRANAHIRVDGKGLILGGGNNAGRATGQMVFATLICEATAPFNEFSSTLTGVPLSASGDFVIDDVLSSATNTALPFQCASPMLLIRSAGTGNNWFAVGIPR